jgi:hypothetical protein
MIFGLKRCDGRHTEKLAQRDEQRCASLISIKSPRRQDRLWFWPHEFEVYAMWNGFPHGASLLDLAWLSRLLCRCLHSLHGVVI